MAVFSVQLYREAEIGLGGTYMTVCRLGGTNMAVFSVQLH